MSISPASPGPGGSGDADGADGTVGGPADRPWPESAALDAWEFVRRMLDDMTSRAAEYQESFGVASEEVR
ncbi:MAG: hypothetical protein ACRDYE_12935 [Acidimicrobiales bacterium]